MKYQDNTAISFEMVAQSAPQTQPSRDFGVVEGRGLDAQARQGVSAEFFSKLIKVSAIFAIAVVIGLARIAITTQTASIKSDDMTLRDQIQAAQTLEGELRVEESVLSSNHRIASIASKHFGMVQDVNKEQIDIPAPQTEDTQAA